jgi:uncharacterized protein (TIGR00251 family)
MSDVNNAVTQHSDGALLALFVTSNADRTIFPAGYNSWRKRIEIKVVATAKDNKANIEVINTVAMFFHASEKDITHGKKSREKTVLIKHVSAEEITNRLKEPLHGL